ncbi:MAG TPA: HEAT repeat domain-containing protein [Kofleriaceae bacterium]
MQRLALFAMVVAVAACGSKPSDKPQPGAASGSSVGGAGAGSAGAGSAAAGSAAGAGSAPGPAATPVALVQQWGAANLHLAADSVRVTPFGVTIGGVELFWVSDSRPAGDDNGEGEVRLVGVVGGVTGKIVEDRELMLAVIAAKPAAKDLAKVALGMAQRDGDVLDRADGPDQKAAKVGPPAASGNALAFWVLTSESPRSLEHGQLDLTTGKLELTPPAMPEAKIIDQAILSLDGPTVKRHAAAAGVLADHCQNARALQALQNALSGHPRVRTRVAVTEQIHRCGPPAIDALLAALDQDKSSVVRQGAAVALGRLGDGRARAALAKASRSEDANLAYAAKSALGKLH